MVYRKKVIRFLTANLMILIRYISVKGIKKGSPVKNVAKQNYCEPFTFMNNK